ncbi:ras family-domain-containing protein [Blastocladiella britannica]|nr:ras family-domain-containing protein [Blastocladiella britannica]
MPPAAEDKFELVVVGSGGVGKSCLTIRFLKDDFTSDYDPTVEENYRKSVVVDSQPCQLSIVDTAGQHEYEALRDQHLSSGNGFLLVCAVNAESSLDEIKQLRERIVMARNKKRLPMVAVGNKCDLPESDHQITLAAAQALFAQYKIPYFESSAKLNINVTEAFQELVRQCRKDALKTSTNAVEKTGAVAGTAKSAAAEEEAGKQSKCCAIQ